MSYLSITGVPKDIPDVKLAAKGHRHHDIVMWEKQMSTTSDYQNLAVAKRLLVDFQSIGSCVATLMKNRPPTLHMIFAVFEAKCCKVDLVPPYYFPNA